MNKSQLYIIISALITRLQENHLLPHKNVEKLADELQEMTASECYLSKSELISMIETKLKEEAQ